MFFLTISDILKLKKVSECAYCEASIMWHQLSTKLVQYMAPENPIRPPDVYTSDKILLIDSDCNKILSTLRRYQSKKYLMTRSQYEKVHQNRINRRNAIVMFHFQWLHFPFRSDHSPSVVSHQYCFVIIITINLKLPSFQIFDFIKKKPLKNR